MSETTILENNSQMNEETIFENGNYANEENAFSGENVENGQKKPKKDTLWAKVTLGGVSAVLIGGATAAWYAHSASAEPVTPSDGGDNGSDNDKEPDKTEPEIKTEPEAKPTTEEHVTSKTVEEHRTYVHHIHHDDVPYVKDLGSDISFGDAFAIARDEVGPGGIFCWRGGIYSTFYKEEWDAMTPAEKADFIHQVPDAVPVYKLAHYPTDNDPYPFDGPMPQDPFDGDDEDNPESDPLDGNGGFDNPGDNDDIIEVAGHTVDKQTAQNFELGNDIHVVGYGDDEGHLIVGYDNNNDSDIDFAIIDVDDSHDISEPDIIIDTVGNSNTVAEVVENITSTEDNVIETFDDTTDGSDEMTDSYDDMAGTSDDMIDISDDMLDMATL